MVELWSRIGYARALWIKKEGYVEATARQHDRELRKLVDREASLLDTESVEETIAKQNDE